MPHYYTISFSLFDLSFSLSLSVSFLSLYFLEIERDTQKRTNHQTHTEKDRQSWVSGINGFIFRSEQWQLRSLIQDLIDRWFRCGKKQSPCQLHLQLRRRSFTHHWYSLPSSFLLLLLKPAFSFLMFTNSNVKLCSVGSSMIRNERFCRKLM